MELRHLRYFVAVAEAENVTRAAAKLRVAQPAVSRQIRDLEDELGIALLERSAKAVRLTEAGRVFLGEAKAVLQRSDEAVKAARAVAGGLGGELHVGYAPSLTVQILPRALRTCQTDAPGLRILLHDLSTEEMLTGLRDGKLHVALMVEPNAAQLRSLRFQELARYPLCVAVAPAHPLARSRSLTLAQIATESLIGYTRADYPEYHHTIDDIFAREPRRPSIVEEHDGFSSVIAAVEAGHGIALVPSCMECMTGPRLKIVPLTPPTAPIVVGAVCRKDSTSAAAEKFVAACQVR